MRPRKRVLIFATNEAAATRVAFVLDTRQYKVRVSFDPDSYAALLADFRPDVALILFCGEGEPMAIEASRQATESDVRVLVALMGRVRVWRGLAHAVVQERPQGGFMAEMLEHLRPLAGHKRGPKKADSANTLIIQARGLRAAEQSARMLA